MSNYYAPAIHPKTKRIEQAEYLDNHYGHHRYGVRFADGSVWPVDKVHARHAQEEADRVASLSPKQGS